MRVALALTGQFRVRPKCIESIRKNLLSNISCDVFVCTWDKQVACYSPISTDRTTIVSGNNSNQQDVSLDIPKYYFGKYSQYFPVETHKVQGFKNVFKKTYEKLLTKEESNIDVSIINTLQPKCISVFSESDFEQNYSDILAPVNQKKQFFLLKKVSEQICSYEADNNFKYDIVIRMRLDQGIDIFPNIEYLTNITENEIYGFFGLSFGIDDCFFLGHRNTVLKVFDIWTHALKNRKFLSPFVNYKLAYSHLLLFLWLTYNNIEFVPCNGVVKPYDSVKEGVFDYFKPLIKEDLSKISAKVKLNYSNLLKLL